MFRRIANSLFLLGLVPWVGVFVLSVMLFDAPGAESSPLTQGVFYSVAAYPVLVIVGFFSSNGFWRMRDERDWRRHLALLPLLSIIAVCVFAAAIGVACDGRLACAP